MTLREALIKHLQYLKDYMDDVLWISIELNGIDDRVEISSFEVVKDNYWYSEFEQLSPRKTPFCLEVTLQKTSPYLKKISKEMEHEFIEVEQREYFEYYLPFQDVEKGADKCIELFASVWDITSLEQVDIKTETHSRIYSTEKLPRPKPQPKPKLELEPQPKVKRKTTRKPPSEWEIIRTRVITVILGSILVILFILIVPIVPLLTLFFLWAYADDKESRSDANPYYHKWGWIFLNIMWWLVIIFFVISEIQ